MTRFVWRPTLAGVVLVVAVSISACTSAGSTGAGTPVPVDPNAVRIVASSQQFVTKDVLAPAGKPFQIALESQTGDPHNINIAAAGAEPAFRSEVYTGPGTKTFEVQPLAAGTYKIKCDVHPGMEGTLTAR